MTRTSTRRGPGRPERGDRSILKEAEDLGLQVGRHVADLVQQQRPPLGHLDQAGLGRPGGRVRARCVAEQLAFDQRRRQRSAVDGLERPLPSGRGVDGARADLLAHARLADQQQLGAGAGELPQPHELQRQRGRRRRHRAERRRGLLPQGLERVAPDLPEDSDLVPEQQDAPVREPLAACQPGPVEKRAVSAPQIERLVAAEDARDPQMRPREQAIRKQERHVVGRGVAFHGLISPGVAPDGQRPLRRKRHRLRARAPRREQQHRPLAGSIARRARLGLRLPVRLFRLRAGHPDSQHSHSDRTLTSIALSPHCTPIPIASGEPSGRSPAGMNAGVFFIVGSKKARALVGSPIATGHGGGVPCRDVI